jgi:putative ABC transport system substrate-binding protein
MRRREFIAGLGSAVAWPAVGQAQQSALPVIGFLTGSYPEVFDGFRLGLSEAGFMEGRNVAIEYRWGNDQIDRLPALAADLVRRQVRVIVALGPAAVAAKASTTTIPVVFSVAVDPVAAGLVASLNRPGGNLTGATNLGAEVGPKRLELLQKIIPSAAVAILVNPTNPLGEPLTSQLEEAARKLGMEVHLSPASSSSDFDMVFANVGKLGMGLVITPDQLFLRRAEELGALALCHAVPAFFQTREFAVSGGLMSYGGSVTDGHRQMGVYAGRVLKGEKPADLPVVQPTKFELIINLKTAEALGLTIPETLLATADEVIQ